jgi:hypothetical protein
MSLIGIWARLSLTSFRSVKGESYPQKHESCPIPRIFHEDMGVASAWSAHSAWLFHGDVRVAGMGLMPDNMTVSDGRRAGTRMPRRRAALRHGDVLPVSGCWDPLVLRSLNCCPMHQLPCQDVVRRKLRLRLIASTQSRGFATCGSRIRSRPNRNPAPCPGVRAARVAVGGGALRSLL